MKARKKLAVALALLLVTSGSAFALGLGQIKVKSALDQPLVAEIPVVSATAAELRGLKVSLASNEDFQRAGINRARLDTPLKFKVEKRAGSTVIVITSEKPVSDPALDLLLELNWSSGKLLREYSVLLDPPGMPAAAARKTAVATSAAGSRKAAPTKPTARTTPRKGRSKGTSANSAAASTPRATPSIGMGASYTAQSGDNVWSIAKRSTARAGNINRMMVAIQRANPDAFYKDNINALKKGAVLRIPDRADMDQINAGDARAEVQRQNMIWSNPDAATPSMMAGSSRNATGGAGSRNARSDSRLDLVPPGGSDTSGAGRSGVAGGSGQAAVAGIKQELSRAKEELASEKQRSDDLATRVKDLEGIRDNNQRLLKLKNAQIAQLQEKLAKANEAQPAAAASTKALREDIFDANQVAAEASVASAAQSATVAGAAPATAASSEMTPSTAMAATAAAPATAVAATSMAPASPAASEKAKPVQAKTSTPMPAARKPVPEKPWYMQTWAWIIAALVILGLILFGFLGRRGKGADSRQDRLSGALADDAHGGDEGLVDDSEDEYALLEEIEQHPDELSLHLELASLYYAHRDQDKFEGAAEAMYAHVDDPEQPEWQQVRAMGEELCPDHPLFAELHSDGHGAQDSDSELAAMVEEDQNHHDDDKASAGDGHGYNFDFDLTPAGAGARDNEDSPDHDPIDSDRHEPADDTEDEDLLSLSTLEPTRSSDDADASASVDEFDTDAILAEATSESPEVPDDPEPAPSADDESTSDDVEQDSDDDDFSSNPVDTKLDLARAYQDMGDDEGARAMLEEVLQEGSDTQKDAARKLLDELGNS
ncbi:MAG: FimV/HubP family polar landmark protein [Rhodanobacteraceae bacterium]